MLSISPPKTAAAAGRGRLLAVLVVIGLIAASLLGAARAEAAPVYHEHFKHKGHGWMAPLSDIVAAYLANDEDAVWAKYSNDWTSPGNHRYAMYRANGKCLDVKQGAATQGAELTTSPCASSSNSQWWALVNGTLTPWHTAASGLVATYHYPANPWAWHRLVLSPRVGLYGNLEQQFSQSSHVIPH